MKNQSLPIARCLLAAWLAASLASPFASSADVRLTIRDSPADVGNEPDNAIDPTTNPNGEMWESRDIWVTTDPIMGYRPVPFDISSPPPWLVGDPNQNPQWRDPTVKSQPNFVYVRITNFGSDQSAGTEQLHVYWAKASTGLSWPSQWVDYMDNRCGPTILYGIEITKPRQNIATAAPSDVANYLAAVNQIATDPALVFPGTSKTINGTPYGNVQFWYQQDAEHNFVAQRYLNGPVLSSGSQMGEPTFSAHGSDGFWPWHREFINRYEALLQKANPLVTLMYWDWTVNPIHNASDPTSWPAALDAMVQAASPSGFGTFNGTIASAFNNVSQITDASQPVGGPGGFSGITTTVTRHIDTTPEPTADATLVGIMDFAPAAAATEGRTVFTTQENSATHNYSHVFIGGNTGNMSVPGKAAEDPFFFLLHANVDKIWSDWQRASTSDTSRWDPSGPPNANAVAYGASQNFMYQPMAPWNGLTYNGTMPDPAHGIVVSPMTPWTRTGGDETYPKLANDSSVVFPPVYDSAYLTIPKLLHNQSIVIEIPWYPPNPMDYSCFADSGHVCLLARITPGIDNGEGSVLYDNVKNNRAIAWRNETVLDGGISPPGPLINDAVLVRSFSSASPVQLSVSLDSVGGLTLDNYGQVLLDLGPILYQRWLNNGAVGLNFTVNTNNGVSPTAVPLTRGKTRGYVANIPMGSNELQQVQIDFLLDTNYFDPQGHTYGVSLMQFGGGTIGNGGTNALGGQHFTFNFNQIDLVPKHSSWRYLDNGQDPGSNWNQLGLNDSQWATGNAKLGYGFGDEVTVLSSGPPDSSYITTWFRYDFIVNQPRFFTNLWLQLEAYDGAVVYLNGVEIARQGMPNGLITPTTPALAEVSGLAADTFYAYDVTDFVGLLGVSNVVAVEVHVADTNNSAELGMDLELSGNVFEPNFPPRAALTPIAINNPPNSGLYLYGQPITLQCAAVAAYKPIQSVTYYGDGNFLGIATAPPFTVVWNLPPPGAHQVTTVVNDTFSAYSQSFATLQVLTNVPPNIYMSAPAVGRVFPPNVPITLSAEVQKIGGGIQKVDFYYFLHGNFGNPIVLAGTATSTPYTMQLSGLAPGTYMVYAVAIDNKNAASWAVPVHICILDYPTLAISNAPPYIILSWSPTNAFLQKASSISGPWLDTTNLSSPYGFIPDPTNRSLFFRSVLNPSSVEALCAP